MANLLLENVEYAWEETSYGTWRRYVYPNGQLFAEYQSNATLPNGWPLVHITWGRCPETGRRKVAKGGLAIGRLAVGIVAIGQASAGIIGIGQATLGLAFGLGQATLGFAALGQMALGLQFGLGQFATGWTAIGQFAIGRYALGQVGMGTHVLSTQVHDPAAVEYFAPLLQMLGF